MKKYKRFSSNKERLNLIAKKTYIKEETEVSKIDYGSNKLELLKKEINILRLNIVSKRKNYSKLFVNLVFFIVFVLIIIKLNNICLDQSKNFAIEDTKT